MTIEIGNTYPSNHYGDFTVLQKNKDNTYSIEFINTGTIQSASARFIKTGAVRDTSLKAPKRGFKIEAGCVRTSLKCGDFEVLDRRDNLMTIRFLDTGTVLTHVHRSTVSKGAIHDPRVPRQKKVTTWVVGSRIKTRKCGTIEIIKNIPGRRALVLFLDTGFVKEVLTSSIYTGKVHDDTLPRTLRIKEITMKNRMRYTVGDKFITKSGLAYEIVEIVSHHDITIKFEGTGSTRKVKAANLRDNVIKDYFQPSVCGVGYRGIEGKIDKHVYKLWECMISRVSKHKNYKDCSVDPAWYNFSTFARDIQLLPNYQQWYDTQGQKKWSFDKDLKVPGNKCYSASTCIFMELVDNSLEAFTRTFHSDTELGAMIHAELRKKYGLDQ